MDNFQLCEEIGKGNFCTAYKGRHRRTTTFFAILSVDKSRRARVMNSVHILRDLKHTNVIKFHSWFETKNHLWMITEYCAGGNLSVILKDTVMKEVTLRVLGRDIAIGLMHIHSMGYLYNDLKPDNLLMDSIPSLRYYDFGNSCPVSQAATHSLIGTPAYMAPELFLRNKGGVISVASDLWSLGCLLYEMATGAPPFVGTDLPSLLHNVFFQPTPTVPGGSAAFNQLLTGLLEKDPRKRYTWAEVSTSEFWEEFLPLPINGFPTETAYLETISTPYKPLTEDEAKSIISAAVSISLRNQALSAKSEESLKSNDFINDELDFTQPSSVVEETAVEQVGNEVNGDAQGNAKALKHGSAGKTGEGKPDAMSGLRRMSTVKAPVGGAKGAGPSGNRNQSNAEQPQLSKADRAMAKARETGSAAQGGSTSPKDAAGPQEGEKQADRETDEKTDVEVLVLDCYATMNLKERIWHPSDSHIRPLSMNSRIEAYEEPTVKQDQLPFQFMHRDELTKSNHETLTTFLSAAYRALSEEKDESSELNILYYFELICKDASVANILINSTMMDYCFRRIEDQTVSTKIRYSASTLIGQLVRYAIFIHQDVVRASFIQRSINCFYANENYIRIQRRLLVFLGEVLFYISVQNRADREGWAVPVEAVQQIYLKVLTESKDEVLRFYAIKAIENIASVTDRYISYKLFGVPEIVQQLILIYKCNDWSEPRGEHMRSSAICAVCKLASLSDRFLTDILLSKVFPMSDYPEAIRTTSLIQTAQLLLTLVVYGLHRFVEMARTKSDSYRSFDSGENCTPESLMALLVEASQGVLDAVKSLKEKNSIAMKGKTLLVVSLLANVGSATLIQMCTKNFVSFLDRLMIERDAYVQSCLVPCSESLRSFIQEKLRLLTTEVSTPADIRTMRHLLSSTVLRRCLCLNEEAFQYMGECMEKALASGCHHAYEDEFHSLMECFLASEYILVRLHFVCAHLIPVLQKMVKASESASRFFGVQLLSTFVQSLRKEFSNANALPDQEAVETLRNAIESVAEALPNLVQEPAPLPSHTFRLLAFSGKWCPETLVSLGSPKMVRMLFSFLTTTSGGKLGPASLLQVLQVIVSQNSELAPIVLKEGFLLLAVKHLPLKPLDEGVEEATCELIATLFPITSSEAEGKEVLLEGMLSEREAEILVFSVVEHCTRFLAAANGIEGMVHASSLAQKAVLSPRVLQDVINLSLSPFTTDAQDILLPLVRAIHHAVKMQSWKPAPGTNSGLIRSLYNVTAQGWCEEIAEEAQCILKETGLG